jgi:hypothetical protein
MNIFLAYLLLVYYYIDIDTMKYQTNRKESKMIKKTYTMFIQYKNIDGTLSNSIDWSGSDFKNGGNVWSCESKEEATAELEKAVASLKAGDYRDSWIIEVQANIDNYEVDTVYDKLAFDYNIDTYIVLSKQGKQY